MNEESRSRADFLVEEGSAFQRLLAEGRLGSGHPPRRDRLDVIVIGAGQAGLSVGHHLAARGLRFVILDATARVGDAWRRRWDSLRLFTPARFDGLDGMPFPAPPDSFPTKDEMADYLEAYAQRFALPVRTGSPVRRLSREGARYVVETGAERLEADHVVVAMASFQKPRLPEFANELRADVVQIHSHDYRRPAQLRDGAVLVAGGGNSGAEIALELAREHRVWMSGRDTGEIPFRIDGFAGRLLLVRLVLRGLFHRVLTVATPIGRKVRRKVLHQGGPLIRTKTRHLTRVGVERVPKVTGVRDGLPRLEDGRVLDVTNVVWCTGYHPGFSWIDLPIFDEHGDPDHDAGVSRGEPGLYFVGLHFLYAMSSTMIHGVGRDAQRIVRVIAERQRARATLSSPGKDEGTRISA